MLADWVLSPLVGRDIVEMSTVDPQDYEVRHNIFQPGETVVHHRRAARYVHVIVEGDVDIVGDGDGGEERAASRTDNAIAIGAIARGPLLLPPPPRFSREGRTKNDQH